MFVKGKSLFLEWDAELLENKFEVILCRKAGVKQVAFDVRPVAKTVVIIYLQFIGNDKWDVSESQQLSEHN